MNKRQKKKQLSKLLGTYKLTPKQRRSISSMSLEKLTRIYNEEEGTQRPGMARVAGQELMSRASNMMSDVVMTFAQIDMPTPNYSVRIAPIEKPEDALAFYNKPVHDSKSARAYIEDLRKALLKMGFEDPDEVIRIMAENESELRMLAEDNKNRFHNDLYEMAQTIVDDPDKYGFSGKNSKMIKRISEFDAAYAGRPAIEGGFWGF